MPELQSNVEATPTRPDSPPHHSVRDGKQLPPCGDRIVSPTELEAHNGSRGSPDDIWMAVDGIVYDVTSFIKEHPGGDIIRISMGTDGTAAVEQHHTGKAMKLVNASLRKRCKRVGTLQGYKPVDNSFFTTLRDRIDDTLAKDGLHRHSYDWLFVIECLITFVAACYFIYLKTFHGSYLAALAAAFFVGRAGLIMHISLHAGATRYAWLNWALGWFNCFAGLSTMLWVVRHQRNHHLHTNDASMDKDCIAGAPNVRMHPDLPAQKSYSQYYQVYAIVLLGISSGFYRWVWNDFWKFLDGRDTFIVVPRNDAWEWAQMVVAKTTFVGFHFVLPLVYCDWRVAVLANIIFMVALAQYMQNNFIINHIHRDNMLADREGKHWAVQQVISTTNWRAGEHGGNWVSGGLNHQIEHHLFPTISYFLYPKVSNIVRQTCKEYGLPYHNHKTFFGIWTATFSFLRDLGREAWKGTYHELHAD